MKKIILLAMLMVFAFSAVASAAIVNADVWVNGHYRCDGSYVDGHYRSNPDGNKDNNWSTRGNTNPHTGV